MTNRQLSAFVREGFLEWKHEPSESCTIHSTYWFKENEQDDEAKEHITKHKDENGNDVIKVQKIVCRLPIVGLDWIGLDWIGMSHLIMISSFYKKRPSLVTQ